MSEKYIFIEYKRAEFLRVYCSTKQLLIDNVKTKKGFQISYFNAINDVLTCDLISSIDRDEAVYFFHKKGFLYVISINGNHYFYNNNKDLMTDFECSVLYMTDICDLFKFFSVDDARSWIEQEDFSQFPKFVNGIKIYPLIKEIIQSE